MIRVTGGRAARGLSEPGPVQRSLFLAIARPGPARPGPGQSSPPVELEAWDQAVPDGSRLGAGRLRVRAVTYYGHTASICGSAGDGGRGGRGPHRGPDV